MRCEWSLADILHAIYTNHWKLVYSWKNLLVNLSLKYLKWKKGVRKMSKRNKVQESQKNHHASSQQNDSNGKRLWLLVQSDVSFSPVLWTCLTAHLIWPQLLSLSQKNSVESSANSLQRYTWWFNHAYEVITYSAHTCIPIPMTSQWHRFL